MRGGFGSKSIKLSVAKELEGVARLHVIFEQYVSGTDQNNIKFDDESVLKEYFSVMGLLEKAKREFFFICFTFDFAEICSTTKRGHALAGMKKLTRILTSNHKRVDTQL